MMNLYANIVGRSPVPHCKTYDVRRSKSRAIVYKHNYTKILEHISHGSLHVVINPPSCFY